MCVCAVVDARVRWVHENGQGSAIDIARRNCVRQISESDVGMLDMVFRRSLVSLTNKKLNHALLQTYVGQRGNEGRVCFAGKTYSFGYWDLLSGAKHFGPLQGHY